MVMDACKSLTVNASSWPLKTQIPEMQLSLFVPKRMTLAKAFLRSLSSRWNIPEEKSESVLVHTMEKLFSATHLRK